MINKNLVLSIQQKIRNTAKSRHEDTEKLLNRYVSERFLYRLSISDYKEMFFLKGAFLFAVWGHEVHRATRDIDFLGNVPAQAEALEAIIKKICSIPCEEDGVFFDLDSIKGAAIREGKSYGGVRVKGNAMLGKSRMILQVDIGFGDVVTPDAQISEIPSIIDMPPARVKTYPIYTVIAEKLEAIISLGLNNSRMKDFYDVWFLIGKFDLDRTLLKEAIANTFERRRTVVQEKLPVGLSEEFSLDESKNIQWNAFLRKNDIAANGLSLSEVVEKLNQFFLPLLPVQEKL